MSAKKKPAKATKNSIDCGADHAERLLHTDFGAYLDHYTPSGAKKDAKRPDR